MGWASGSQLAEDIWNIVKKDIPKKKQKKIAKKIIAAFENEDCDTIDEAEALCKAAGREAFEHDDEYEDDDFSDYGDEDNED